MSHIFKNAPPELVNNCFIENGTLFVTEQWRSEPEFLSFTGLLKKRGVTTIEFVSASEFQKKKSNSNIADETSQQSELQKYAINLFKNAYTQKASDIHIADYGSYGIIEFRCLGLLRIYEQLPGNKITRLISVIYNTIASNGSTTSHSARDRQDSRISKKEYLPSQVHSIRVHTEPLDIGSEGDSTTGCLMLLRLLYDRTEASGNLSTRLTSLGYTPSDANRFRFLTQRSGLTIISGPTGHGKSTLLKHVMEAQAEECPEKSFQSIEDPPEYPLANVKQIMVATKVKDGDSVKRGNNYVEAIAGAMRSDPDVLMIGEIRYPEAAVAAIDAALTGHAVWATLHANSAIGIIMRMVSLLNAARYAEPLEYLCDHNVLAGLVYQRLVPVLCSKCKIKIIDASEEHKRQYLPAPTFNRVLKAVNSLEVVHMRGSGCEHCKKLGFTDQTVASEVIVTDNKILKFIRQGYYSEAYQYWRDPNSMNGKTFIEDAVSKIERGILDPHMTELRLGVPLNFDASDTQFKESLDSCEDV